jgi:hypothetical protein
MSLKSGSEESSKIKQYIDGGIADNYPVYYLKNHPELQGIGVWLYGKHKNIKIPENKEIPIRKEKEVPNLLNLIGKFSHILTSKEFSTFYIKLLYIPLYI